MVKSYQLFLLDDQYRKEVDETLGDVSNGTVDADDALEKISNITKSYDGKAKMLIKENATFDNLITLEMISWVRDNFIIESMVDGVPRGLMTQRLVKINETLANNDNSAEKLGVIQHEMFEDYYEEPEEIVSDGPTLSINGINAQWENWEFESVGPTSNLLGSFSDRCENLTSIPGIGTKNCNNFYEAGYMTPESIISASDEELLTIPGVGISFIKKLRKTLGRL